MGTRFVASQEAYAHESYKKRIVEIDDEGTTVSRCFSGKPCRVIKNDTTQAWESRDLQDQIARFPRQFRVISDWLGEDPYIAARRKGRIDKGAMAAGQSSVLIHDLMPAAEIIERLMAETDHALRAVDALR